MSIYLSIPSPIPFIFIIQCHFKPSWTVQGNNKHLKVFLSSAHTTWILLICGTLYFTSQYIIGLLWSCHNALSFVCSLKSSSWAWGWYPCSDSSLFVSAVIAVSLCSHSTFQDNFYSIPSLGTGPKHSTLALIQVADFPNCLVPPLMEGISHTALLWFSCRKSTGLGKQSIYVK